MLGDRHLTRDLEPMLASIPRGKQLLDLLELFKENQRDYEGGLRGQNKSSSKTDQFLNKYVCIFRAITNLETTEPATYRRFVSYFSKAATVKKTSQMLHTPHILVSTEDPIILEARVFDIKWGSTPFAAGFHSWYVNSFHFNNAFAEQVRYDKNTTTDLPTIISIARRNTTGNKTVVKKKIGSDIPKVT